MPGEQVSIANRRLIIERSVLNSWKVFAADLQAVTGRFHPLMLVAPPADEIASTFAEAHSKRRLVTAATQPDLDASTESLVGFAINQVEQVRDLYGRYSRLSTLASELLSARSGLSISEKMIVVKEACSSAFAFEAERLVPWLVEIHARGAGEELRNLLGTCLAEEMTASAIALANGSEQVVTIRNLFGDMPESGSTNRCWGIPADGLKINLSPPETFQNGDALLIQDTDISHLHLLATAKAIVATKGSTLSHLMQHARLLRIPYIVGASVDLVGEGGMAVTLTSQGEILHA
jgi:phosphohistidine swiveling domain-containing protein